MTRSIYEQFIALIQQPVTAWQIAILASILIGLFILWEDDGK